jgi:phosphoglucosamine mutase
VLKFGTDGVRGVAYTELTRELVEALGRAAARVLGTERPFVIGRDTRQSGPMLEGALAAGVTAAGADVERLGVVPTPAVAFVCGAHDVPGAVISASHNPFPDNGVKLFGRGGRKLTDEQQAAIEVALRAEVGAVPTTGTDVGTVSDPDGVVTAYVDHLTGALEGRTLSGVRVVLDCGHGAASAVAPAAFRAAGADVVVLNAEPDGTNINEGCGATAPAIVQRAVREHGAVAGLAFDGDADRVIAADEQGGLVDGDHILAIAALDLDQRARLAGRAVAGTVMANLGLRRALAAAGIGFVETPVGDRAVLEAMERDGLSLGGEQSGHVIFADYATTGDGLLTGLLLLDAMVRSGEPLSKLAAVVTKFPQVLRNVRVARLRDLDRADGFWSDVEREADDLGDTGRVLVRPSGTEPVVRIMVEASKADVAERAAARLSESLISALGAG